MNTIHIPTPLRPFTDKKESVEVNGNTVGELLADLAKRYGGLRKHLYADDGKLRSFVNVYLNDEDIRYLEREQTPVKPGDSLSIVPSVAGGAPIVTTPPGRGTSGPTSHAGVDQDVLPALSQDEIKRYSRHLIMPEVGIDGQRKLKASSVLCIGAGGLGSPAAMYLAAAGVGRIGIVDFDVVDFSNLQRQLLHGTPDVGRSKLASAKDRLHALNPHVQVETYETSPVVGERPEVVRAVRRDPRRHGQLSDAVSGKRRVRHQRQAQRVRQHLPVRGPGIGLRDPGWSLLSLPLSRTAPPPASCRAARRGGSLVCCQASSG